MLNTFANSKIAFHTKISSTSRVRFCTIIGQFHHLSSKNILCMHCNHLTSLNAKFIQLCPYSRSCEERSKVNFLAQLKHACGYTSRKCKITGKNILKMYNLHT